MLANGAANMLGEIGRAIAKEVRRRTHGQRLGRRGLGFVGGDETRGSHGGQNLIAAGTRQLGFDQRRVATGRLRDAGQGGGLGQIQIADGFVEIAAGSRGHAIRLMPEEDLVEIQGEDLVLAVAGL